jgi:hypothetical protein
VDALAEAKRITNFEGRRRQMQFIGKLMRKLDDSTVQAIEAALEVQHQGSRPPTRCACTRPSSGATADRRRRGLPTGCSTTPMPTCSTCAP